MLAGKEVRVPCVNFNSGFDILALAFAIDNKCLGYTLLAASPMSLLRLFSWQKPQVMNITMTTIAIFGIFILILIPLRKKINPLKFSALKKIKTKKE